MDKRRLEIILSVAMLLLALLPLLAHMSANDNHRNLANHNYGKNLLNTLEPNSIFMTEGGDNQVFTSAYNQMAEFLRPDVRIYDQKGNVFYRIYGDFRHMSPQEVTIKKDLVDFEIYKRGRPVYLTWYRSPNVAVCGDWFLKRYGLLYKVVPLKYRILEDLNADQELSFKRVHALLKQYYQSAGTMAKLRKNKMYMDRWYIKFIFGQLPNARRNIHFINDEERNRIRSNVGLYSKFVDMALNRKIDAAFTRALLLDLQKEGYLKLQGNVVRFVKDIPAPYKGDYWKLYKFAFRKVSHARDWDYLTREIFTNYNFYRALYLSEKITFNQRRLRYYKNRLKQAFGQKKIALQKQIKASVAKIAFLKKDQLACYTRAAYFGSDTAPIHHNVAIAHLRAGDQKKALESFRKGAKADPYSWQTVYSWIIFELKRVNNFAKPKGERPVLIRMRRECRKAMKRFSHYKRKRNQPADWYKNDQNFKRFRALLGLIQNRMLKGLTLPVVASLARYVNQKPKSIMHRIALLNRLHSRKDYENVVSFFEKGGDEKWKKANMIYWYADSLVKLRRRDEAITALTRLKSVEPDHFMGLFLLAQLYELKKDFKNALALYKDYLLISADDVRKKFPRMHNLYLGRLNYAKRRIGQLEKYLQRLNPSNDVNRRVGRGGSGKGK